MNESNLCTLYEIASRKPGWLSKMEMVLNLSPEESAFVSWLDDQERNMDKRIRQWEQEMRRDGFDEALLDCDTEDEKLSTLGKLMATIEDQHTELQKQDKPYVERALFLLTHRYEHWKKLRAKIRRSMLHKDNPRVGITDFDIERARNAKFESLTEVVRGYIRCLWHEDASPSMWVKHGWGWCFVCNAWCDPIKWWIKKYGKSFPEAVKDLNRQ